MRICKSPSDIRAVELFCGNADLTKVFREYGMQCESVDYNPKYKPDVCADVYNLGSAYLGAFDFIWLSPCCTTYSRAAHGLHREYKDLKPKTLYAKQCDNGNAELFKLLKELDIPFIAENPLGMFGWMPWCNGLFATTVYYSSYGGECAKPTELFSNRFELICNLRLPYKKGARRLDSISYSDFLGRCKMPKLLLECIAENVIDYLVR